MINFTCSCGNKLEVSDKFAGKPGQCPACGKQVTVPVKLAMAGTAGSPEQDPVSTSASPVISVAIIGKRVPGLGIAGLCVGIAAIIVCWIPVLGLLVGLVGLGLAGSSFLRSRSDESVGRGIPIAGLSVSSTAMILGLVFTVVFLAAQYSTSREGGANSSPYPNPSQERIIKGIKFQCTSCDKQLEIDAETGGGSALAGVQAGTITRIKCPHCRRTVEIPEHVKEKLEP